MGEGHQTESGERAAEPRGKIVRLPRDWLGPREELVPFGPRSAPPEGDETPPSPADFWGEQSAELQSALRGPAVREDPDDGPDAAPAIRFGRVDRRAMTGVAAALIIAAATVVAVVANSLGPGGTPTQVGGSKIGFATVFSGGISSILRLDLGRTAVARVATPKIRRTRHESAPKRSQKRARPRPRPSVSASPRIVSYAATATGGTETHSETPPATRSAPPRSASRPVASRATVNATGQSGALGPIQSPNG